jgi:uracil-DNA glycosylase family 4
MFVITPQQSNLQSKVVNAAQQHAETNRLLGVDFLPLHTRPMAQPAEAASSTKARLLDVLRARHDQECRHCTAVTYHRQTVFGDGSPDAAIMFIGEAPGEEEDKTGRPFVGRAGQKLDDIIRAMGFARGDVYIANVLKSRPPENRTPLPNEIECCAPFLAEQIRIIQPQVLVALGGPAAKLLLRTDVGITRLRGQWGWY